MRHAVNIAATGLVTSLSAASCIPCDVSRTKHIHNRVANAGATSLGNHYLAPKTSKYREQTMRLGVAAHQ